MSNGPLRIRLTLDRGLAAYLRAYLKGVGIQSNEREAIIYFVREALISRIENKQFRRMMMPHLPADFRKAWERDQ